MEDMLMIRRCFCVLPAVVVLAASIVLPAKADDKSCESPKCGTMTKTICCPEYTTEKRTVEAASTRPSSGRRK